MPMWRCPHCGTPQAETARCWVCRRSSTSCATCRHYRRSVASQLGYCGLDRQRRPLHGDEMRACWEAATTPVDPPAPTGARFTPEPGDRGLDRTPVRRLEFIEVRATPDGSGRRAAARAATEAGATPPAAAQGGIVSGPVEPRWSLWGDLET